MVISVSTFCKDNRREEESRQHRKITGAVLRRQ